MTPDLALKAWLGYHMTALSYLTVHGNSVWSRHGDYAPFSQAF